MRLCPLQGISDEIRAEVWLFLLGYYPFDSTSEERTKIDEDKRFVLMHTKFIMFDYHGTFAKVHIDYMP